MAYLTIDKISKIFGINTAVDNLSISITEGSFVGILGPSGCGKTTLLRLIAGLERPNHGKILIRDRNIADLPPEKRGLGMMFQSYALFPHLTVEENLRFPLKANRIGTSDQQNAKIRQVLELVRLEQKIDRFPKQLSGGEQQRVALARAIIAEPSVLLLDEPLSNLDAKLRTGMQIELIELHQKLGLTTIFVTHDQEEALAMSDMIILMKAGRVIQTGIPEEIYSKPKTPFAADFFGSANLLKVDAVKAANGGWRAILATGDKVPCQEPPGGAEGAYMLMLRQEIVKLTGKISAFDAIVPVKRTAEVYLGAKVRFVIGIGDQQINVLMSKEDAADTQGATHLGWHSDQSLLLPLF